jgi:ribonuclease III
VSRQLARKRTLRTLARKIGLPQSAGLQLLDAALTHESYAMEHPSDATSNERLEFLGDAILGAIVAQALYRLLPHLREDRLSRMRASLVSRDALARSAELLDLGSFVLLGRGEREAGGARRPRILANVFEAIVGAFFLAGGMQGATDFVTSHHLARAQASDTADPKTRLQELIQAKFKKAPHYAVTAQTGPPHERQFTVAVHIGGRVLGRGTGATKREAQSNAAREALANLP